MVDEKKELSSTKTVPLKRLRNIIKSRNKNKMQGKKVSYFIERYARNVYYCVVLNVAKLLQSQN